jgi:hypothetical protein
MNSFKRKALTCAVLAGLGGIATTAEAVYRNPDGTGMVLIYPYYTVNSIGGNAYNTYISVTNTSSVAKVTKVRFREGRTSAEVLDFNVYLSPNDVWVGAVGPSGTDPNAPAAVFGNFETSCTYPQIPAAGQPFVNTVYASGQDALPGTGLDRTREGYVEIFDMATLIGVAATNVTHTAIATAPPNCAAMRVNLLNDPVLSLLLTSPVGGLYGEGTIINVTNGSAVGYKADALDAYRSTSYYADVSSILPQLGASAAPFSMVLANNRAVTDSWTGGPTATLAAAPVRAVAATFMHAAVLNDYVLDVATKSNTDWVLTFPGKHEFYPTNTPVPPYTAVLTTTGACETVGFTFFDRDEQSAVPAPGGFSPQGAGPAPNNSSLCWESTVLSIRNGLAHTSAADVSATDPRSGVLGSKNVRAVSVLGNPPFAAGWLILNFTGANATITGIASTAGTDLTSANTAGPPPGFGPVGTPAGVPTARAHTFFGLPVTGFMVNSRSNASIACTLPGGGSGNCSGSYATLFGHSYRTNISP